MGHNSASPAASPAPMLFELLIFLCAAVIGVPLFRRLGLGSVLGYLVAGLVIGPYGLGLISDVDSLLHFSEFGVVLLMFIIGLELQPKRLWLLRRTVFGLGGAQVLVTGLVLGGLALAAGLSWAAAAIAGFSLALSSTAFVLQMLGERNELVLRHGRAAFGVLLFQDLAVIPLLALVPVIGGSSAASSGDFWPQFLKIAAALALVFGLGRYAIRPLFRQVASARTPEVFTAAALLVIVGAALLMDAVGLSMSLGAFLAGVLLADSEYRHQLQVDIEPFKGLLLGLFFIAVGMSVNLTLLLESPVPLLAMAAALIVVKAVLLYGLARIMGYEHASARPLAVALAQGGEFAFVLFALAQTSGALAPDEVQRMILVVTLSMMATPLLYNAQAKLAQRNTEPVFDTIDAPEHPVIIAGFSTFGQIVGRILRVRKIGFTVLEKDHSQVDFVRRFGSKVYYGDASRLELLRAAHADKARYIVVTISDPQASLQVVQTVRRHFPNLTIFAAASSRRHVLQLADLGVRNIVRRSYNSSLEMTKRLLIESGVEEAEVERTVAVFRKHDEALLARQQAMLHDEQGMIQTAQDAALELEQLFESDRTRSDHSPPKPATETPSS